MPVSDELFLLVKSMTKAEKRYFKLQASLQKGDKGYINLFDAVDGLVSKNSGHCDDAVYDEIILKKKLGGKSSTTQLHVMKHYLYGLLLKSLRILNEKVTTDDQINVLLSEARVLEQKGLYEQCLKKLMSAKSLALKFEKLKSLVEIIQYQILICTKRLSVEVLEELERLNLELAKVIEQLNTEIQLTYLRNQVTAFYRKNARIRAEEDKQRYEVFKNNTLLQNEMSPWASFLTKISFYYCKALLHKIEGEANKTYENYFKIFQLWTGFPHFKQEYPAIFIISSSNFLIGCHLVNDYSRYPEMLKELETVPIHTFDEEAEAFQNIWFLKQLYFMNYKMFQSKHNILDDAIILANAIEKGLKKYNSRMVKSREMTFYNNIAIMFFALGEFGKTLEWLIKIQHSAKTDQRKDLQLFARLLQLIIFTENGEHLYIDNAFKSFEYHLKKEDKSHDFEGKVTRFLKQVVVKKEDKKKLFMDFREELTQFEMLKLPGFEEISIWVESKIRNLPFLEILREKVKEKETKKGPR